MWGPINILEETLELEQKKYRGFKRKRQEKGNNSLSALADHHSAQGVE